MHESVGLSRARDAEPVTPCPGRHCWVTGGAGVDDGVKRPGLLVEWRSGPVGWEGRVLYLTPVQVDRWVVLEEWLPSHLLTPA